MIGKTILHYKVVEKVGEGGMGVVYKAEDTKLDRFVALKFLPRHIASNSEERGRFQIEAKAAAALNHPNIATIYAIEKYDDELFIVMEYIEGQELREMVANLAKVENLRKVLDYATQIASGLQAAHQKGIVHRDIKSSNIMVTESGQTKIMDFGLAKIRGGPQFTKVGTTLGTAAYMSPEQTRGEKVDQRTDIWAFGAVIYEMITGQQPFVGDYEQAVMYSIMNEDPEPLTALRTGVPMELERIVNKCLQKSPANRYQHAEELVVDLRRVKAQLEPGEQKVSKPTRLQWRNWYFVGVAAMVAVILLVILLPRSKSSDDDIIGKPKTESSPKWKNSIAVLPFKNISADKEQEYFCDGMTEQLITNLSNLPKVKVIARTSVMQFKNSNKTIRQIANELGVAHILEGSVRKAGNKIRVTAQLIKADDGFHLWAKDYDRALKDVFDVQDDLSNAIVEALRINLIGGQRAVVTKRHTDNTEAYQFYLKGFYYARKYTPEGIDKGIEYFNKAIAIDPNYALAYDGLAYIYYAATWNEPYKKTMAKGRALAKKALEIDPTLAEAHTSLGVIHTWLDYDWTAAEREFKRALALNPNYASAHLWYGFLLLVVERFDESIAEATRAIELDPLSAEANTILGALFFYMHRYDEAMQQLRTTTDLEPGYWFAHLYLARVLEKKGDIPAAIAELEKTRLMEGAAWEVWSALGYAYALLGKKDEAKKIIVELKEESKRSYVPLYNIATIYAGLGEKDQAFEYLHKEYEQGAYYLCVLNVDPELDNLRSDPRFQALRKKMGLEK